MQKIRVALKVLNSRSKFERKLIRLTGANVPDITDEKQLKPLIQIASNSDITEDGAKALDIFNTYLSDCKTWMPAIKLLYLSHELIDNVGKKFCDSFLAAHFENIHDLISKGKNDVEDFVHGVLAANYYNFLIIYAKYYPDIQTYLSKDSSQLSKSIEQDQYATLVHLISFKNMIKYFTKLEECIEGSASVLKEQGIIDRMIFILARDIIIVYNLISLNLQPSMKYIFEVNEDLAFLLDELYSDMLQISNKLRHMIVKLALEHKQGIPEIKYYPFDAAFNKDEELYILDLKKTRSKQNPETTKKPYQMLMQQYQTLNPGRKLYKLNTGVTHLTKILESNKPKTSEYFNLQSPEFSQMEDESTPIKPNDDNNDYTINQKRTNIIDNTSQLYKDVTHPVQLEIQIHKNKPSSPNDHDYRQPGNKATFGMKNEQEFDDLKGAESVIFSPVSTHKTHGSNIEENFHGDLGADYLAKKQRNNQYTFGNQDNYDKKNYNLNLANL